MFMVRSIFDQIINYGIVERWDIDKKRTYRQVNRFNLALGLISLSALPIAIISKVYLGLFVQLTGAFLYLSGFHLIKKGKLTSAQALALYTFEAHMFIISFFAIRHTEGGLMPWYSPVFASYMLYPLIAALFNRSIFKHMTISILQIALMQFAGAFIIKSGLSTFPQGREDLLNFIICVYNTAMASAIVYLFFKENRKVKDRAIKRSKELEKALNEVNKSREMISRQAMELKELNDTKDKLFSIIAHDLKSPYNTLLGFSEMLKESLENDTKSYEYAQNLYDAALNNYALLENLLEWSRTQMKRIKFSPVEFPLADIVASNIALIGLNAEKKKITIDNKAGNSILVRADKNLVNIIFRNLITNAVKYTYPGGKITIGAVSHDDLAEISIADTGMGIPEKILKNLFLIENKESRAGTLYETGTGLGLILCKEFIDLHGCTIWVESEVKKGSVFRFTLPLAK